MAIFKLMFSILKSDYPFFKNKLKACNKNYLFDLYICKFMIYKLYIHTFILSLPAETQEFKGYQTF